MSPKKSSKSRKAKKKQLALMTVPSFVFPRQASHISNNNVRAEGKPPKSSEISIKTQCDLCKLSYSTEKELSEHLLSIMHHTKMEDKEQNSVHICTLCFVTCLSMADYRSHVITKKHQEKLSCLRGDGDSKNKLRPDTVVKNPSSSKHGRTTFNNHNRQFKGGSFVHKKKKTPVHGRHFNESDQSSYFRFRGNSNVPSQIFKRGFWNAHYWRKNDVYHWPRDQMNNYYSENYDRRHDNGGESSLEPPKQIYEPWGSGYYGDYFDHRRTAEFVLSNWRKEEQDRGRMDNEVTEGLNFQDSLKNVSNTIPDAWDEQLLLQQEQFVAGMDDGHLSSRYGSNQSPHSANSDRQKQCGAFERKQERDKNVQDSFVKHSRSNDIPSDQRLSSVDTQSKTPQLLSDLNDFPKMSEANSKQLNRINPDILKAKKCTDSLQNGMYKAFDKKGHSLPQKLQVHHKDYVFKNSERRHRSEESISDVRSVSTFLSQNHDLSAHSTSNLFTVTAHSGKNDCNSNTLDDIKKSIEKNVLDNEEAQRNVKSSVPPMSKRMRSSSDGVVHSSIGDGTILTAGQPLPKLGNKTQLDRDSLKKIINAPHSRDKRLQLAKMLQSRKDGHKTATASLPPRTNLQLEGLRDSVVVSEKVNLTAGQNCDIQTIKLEDLSDSARNQILDLIGRDFSNIFHCPLEHDSSNTFLQDKFLKEKSSSEDHVVILSDDDDVVKTSKLKTKTPQTVSSIVTREDITDVAKTNKKKKTVSKTSLITSVIPSICNHENSQLSHITCKSNLSPVSKLKKSEVGGSKKLTSKKKEKFLVSTDSDMEVDLCFLGVDLTRKEDKIKKTTKTTLVNTVLSDPSSSNPKQDTSSDETQSSDLSSKQLKSQSKSSIDKEESSIIKVKSMPFSKRNRTNSSILCSSSKSSKQQLDAVSHNTSDILLASSNVQRNLEHSSLNADTWMKPTSDVKKSSSLSQSMVISSLNTEMPSSSEAETTPSCPDSSLTAPQKSQVKAAETLPTSQTFSPSTQLSRSLTLPPSTWLKDRIFPPDSCENHKNPTSCKPLFLSPLNKEPKVEDDSDMTTVITDDEENCISDGEQLPSNRNDSVQVPDNIAGSKRCENHSDPASCEPLLLVPLTLEPKIEDDTEMTSAITDNEESCSSDGEQLPCNNAHSEWLPSYQAGSEQLLNSLANSGQLPHNHADSERLPSNPTDSEGLPSNQTDSERLQSNQADNERLPSNPTDSEGLLSNQTGSEGLQSDEADNERLPSNPTDSEGLPSSQADSEQLPSSQTDGERLPSSRADTAVSVISESSSRVMSELLVLSEREENVKQEKMSLDLRLSRLHKLLEQAVVQINKCTERRQQLHKEEQELSHQRMSLLRAMLSTQDASTLNTNLKCDTNNPTSASSLSSGEHISALMSAPFTQTSKSATSSSEQLQGTSLSRADWLAKFSTFLPCDPNRENQVPQARTFPVTINTGLRELIHHPSISVSSLTDQSVETQRSEETVGKCRDIVRLHSQMSSSGGSADEMSAATTKAISRNRMAAPIMYLGSFKTPDADINVGTYTINLGE